MKLQMQTKSSASARSNWTPASHGLLQRKCACGSSAGLDGECEECRKKKMTLQRRAANNALSTKAPLSLGHDFSKVAVGLQTKLTINQPGDIYEQEADRVAAAIVSQSVNQEEAYKTCPAAPRVQRKEKETPPSEAGKYKEAAKKVGEAFLETEVGKQVKQKAGELGTDFLSTLHGKIITGTAAVGTIAGIVVTNSELPIQVPEIPLDSLAPGLSVKLNYEGPVLNPTAASILFTYKFGGSSAKKPAMTEAEKTRAETARMAEEQAQFRESLKSPEQRAAEEAAFQKALQGGLNKFGLRPLSAPGVEPKREDELLQRKETDASQSVGDVPSIVHEVLRSRGQPLDQATRAFMEPRFGHDFSKVRIHTDANAADSARAVNAAAYTVGRDVVFGDGQYGTSSNEGRKLMAHELTHVMQQASSKLNPTKSHSFVQRQSRKGVLSASKAGLQTVQKPEIETVASFLSKLLSVWLSNANFVQWLQNRYQLPGSLGSIKAGPMEIFENIGTRKGIETTAKRGAKTSGAVAAIPTFFELANAAQAMGAGEFEEAQKLFAKAAGVPGIEKLLNAVTEWALLDQAVDWKSVAAGRDSLITVVTAGLPDTINLISALIYSFSDTPIPEESQFRMDPSVLDELYKYIPEEVDMIYYKLSKFFE